MLQWPKSIGRAWRGIEGIHTVLWLWSLLSGGALAVFASAIEGVPITYAITAGVVLAAAIAHFVNQAKEWFRADVAKSVNVVAETSSEPIANASPLSTDELSGSYFKNRDVYIRELIVDEFRVTNRVFDDCVIHGPAVIFCVRYWTTASLLAQVWTRLSCQCGLNGQSLARFLLKTVFFGAASLGILVLLECKSRNSRNLTKKQSDSLSSSW